MGAPHVLAIDLGTGGPKVALVSLDGEVVGHEIERTELLLSEGGGAEQDPDDWWRGITTATRRLLDRGLAPVEDVVAVAVDAQWLGTVAVDVTGKHLMNAITWMDSRGSRYAREATGGRLRVQGYDVRKLRTWLRVNGALPGHSGKDPTAHILWIKHERPDVYAATATFLEPADYLNLRLCGRVVSSFDCIAGHWVTDNRDIRAIRYDDDLLRLSQLERAKLPDLVPSCTVVGTLTPTAASELGLHETTEVVTATGDVHSAVLGSGALADFAGHIYVGTSAWITCHVPWKRTDVLRNMASLPAALPGRYFVGNENHTAGACLTWLSDNVVFAADAIGALPTDDPLAALNELAATSPAGSNGTLFTPWLNGERTPVDDRWIRGGWHNVSLSTTRADLVRAVFEGVALNARWLLGAVERFTKRRMDPLNFIGGGARSDLWCQILADVLGREIRRVADPQQANVRGAAFGASMALGHATAEELAARVRIDATFRPDTAPGATYERMYAAFRSLYKATKGIHTRLNAQR